MHPRLTNSSLLFLTGALLISTMAMVLVIASLAFCIGLPVAAWQFPVSFLLTSAGYYYIGRNYYRETKIFVKLFLVCLGIISVSIVIALNFYDVSYDGQTYHMEGIYQLKNGWNPFKKLLPESLNLSIYINHYSKGVELPQSTIYSLINHIEAAKATNIILLTAAFCLTLSCLFNTEKLSATKSIVLSLLLTLNPISVNQLISTCVDGQLSTLLLCFLITVVLVIRADNANNLLLLGSIIIIAANVKFTGLVFIVIFTAAFLLWLLYVKKRLLFKKVFYISLASGIIAVLLVGFNPYVTNTLKFEHPFFPLMGKNKVDIMGHNTPNELEGKSPFNKFFISFFSHTDNMIPGPGSRKVELKIPFSLNKNDILSAGKIDSRIGGFGPFFSGIMLISIVLMTFSLIVPGPNVNARNSLYLILVIVLSVCIIPESWWARYVPQLWYVPLIILTCSELYQKDKLKWIRTVMYAALIVNVGLTFIGIGWNFMMTNLIDYQIKQLQSSNEPIHVQWGAFKSNRIRFRENNIPFIEKDLSKEEKIEGIVRSNAIILIPVNNPDISKSKIIQWAEKFR